MDFNKLKDDAVNELDKLHSTEYSFYEGYSGRGMFGKTSSVAFTVNKHPDTDTGKALLKMGFTVDNMGLNYIYYTVS